MRYLRKSWLWLIAFVVSCSVVFGVVQAADVSFTITDQEVTAEVQANGDVKFVQKWRYNIDKVNGVYMKVDAGQYRLGQYRIGMENSSGDITYFTESSAGTTGTFSATTDNDKITTFKVYYPAKNQIVTFVAEYTLQNLVTNYADTAELNRKLIGDGVDSVTNVNAKVILPGKVDDADSFKAWAHGAPQGRVELGEENGRSTVTLTVRDNPSNRFVEVHTIFPTSLTPTNTNVVNENKKTAIEQAEANQVAKDKAEHERSLLIRNVVKWLALAISSLLPIRLWYRYLKRRRELNPHPVQLPRMIVMVYIKLTELNKCVNVAVH